MKLGDLQRFGPLLAAERHRDSARKSEEKLEAPPPVCFFSHSFQAGDTGDSEGSTAACKPLPPRVFDIR